MEEKKKNKALIPLLVILATLVVVLLCVLSSRYSWFGVADNKDSENSVSVNSQIDNGSDSTEVPEEITSQTQDAVTSSTPESVPESAVTPAVSESEQTTPPPATEQTTTLPETETATTTEETTTVETTTVETTTVQTTTVITTTTVATEPVPLWTETECDKEMYVIVSCYSRKEAVVGSTAVSLYNSGTKVRVIATTSTSYSKLADGSFIHNDYLSNEKPAETTTTTAQTAKPPAQIPDGVGEGLSVTAPDSCHPFEIQAFNLINEIRVQNNLPKFKWDPTAYKSAKIRANEVTTVWGHDRPDGSRYYTSLGVGDLLWRVYAKVAENLAWGYSTPKEVVDAWMNSTAHRTNILDPELQCIGIAFSEKNDSRHYYWVQEFTTYN